MNFQGTGVNVTAEMAAPSPPGPSGVVKEEPSDSPRRTRSQTEKEKRKLVTSEESGFRDAHRPSPAAVNLASSQRKSRAATWSTSDAGTARGKKTPEKSTRDGLGSPDAENLKGRQLPKTGEELQPCTHADKGCEWVGTERERSTHVLLSRRLSKRNRKDVCKFSEVSCRYCSESVLYRDLQRHETSECARRPGRCEHCKKTFSVYCKHRETCKSLPVACPNDCGTSVPRRELSAHTDHQCPRRVVPCAFHIAGCQNKSTEEDLLKHKQSSTMEHLRLVRNHLSQNSRRIPGKEIGRYIELVSDCLLHVAGGVGDPGAVAGVEEKLRKLEGQQEALWVAVERRGKGAADCTTAEVHQSSEISQQSERDKCSECCELRQELQELRKMVLEQQQVIKLLSQAASTAVPDNLPGVVEAVTRSVQSCRDECALIRKELQGSSALRAQVTAATERNRGLLLKQSGIIVEQQAELTRQKQKLENLEAELNTVTLPMEFMVNEYARLRLHSNSFYSPPFYTHKEGYRMCIKVYPEGAGRSCGNDISVYAYLMRGEYDHKLTWPFQGSVTVQLINQAIDDHHITHTFHFAESSDPDVIGRVIGQDRAQYGVGKREFASLTHLVVTEPGNICYNQRNSLKFRVLRSSNVDSAAHLVRRCRLLESFMMAAERQLSIAPIGFTLTDFAQLQKQSGVWVSPAFYSHSQGYRFCLEVFPNGVGEAWGSDVSLYVCLMRGPFDDKLQWPFHGVVSVSILNQVRERDHCPGCVVFSDTTPSTHAARPVQSERSVGNGIPRFIAHSSLGADDAQKVLYLHNNRLQIQITHVEVKS